MPSVTIRGARLNYLERGQGGSPVVFSHGFLWSGRMFDAQVAALAPRFRCIAYDHRGQGESEITAGGYSMDDLTLDAAALIESLNLAPCHFVGLSMGGFVGMRLAARRPELVRSLTLMETAANSEPLWKIARYRVLSAVAKVAGLRPLVGPMMRVMFGRKFLTDPARAALRAEQERLLRSNRVDGLRRTLTGILERAGVEAELPKINCPTLIIVGEQDVATVPARARTIHSLIPGSRLEIVPGAGHTSTVEEPDGVNAVLVPFLQTCDQPWAAASVSR